MVSATYGLLMALMLVGIALTLVVPFLLVAWVFQLTTGDDTLGVLVSSLITFPAAIHFWTRNLRPDAFAISRLAAIAGVALGGCAIGLYWTARHWFPAQHPIPATAEVAILLVLPTAFLYLRFSSNSGPASEGEAIVQQLSQLNTSLGLRRVR